jgi:hypothetical protein
MAGNRGLTFRVSKIATVENAKRGFVTEAAINLEERHLIDTTYTSTGIRTSTFQPGGGCLRPGPLARTNHICSFIDGVKHTRDSPERLGFAPTLPLVIVPQPCAYTASHAAESSARARLRPSQVNPCGNAKNYENHHYFAACNLPLPFSRLRHWL